MLMYPCNGFRKIIFVRNWQNLTLKSESETSFAGLQQNIQILRSLISPGSLFCSVDVAQIHMVSLALLVVQQT